jgi:CRISPR/Cas system-associated exonuclease Cas4 (RecB family)
MPNIPPICTATGPTDWASPPEWMSIHYLLAAERCPRSVALRYSRYTTIWKKQGYPEKPHVSSLIGRIVHSSVERIASELAKKGVRSLSDSGAVQVLREMGGYSVVVSRVTEAALISLQDNPRLDRQMGVLRAALRTNAPRIREEVQVLLSRMTWEPMDTSQRAITRNLGSGSTTRGALSSGLHFEAELRDAALKFRGIADSIEVGKTGCTITDFKTGGESENHEFQLRVYALLWQNDSDLNPAGRPATKLTLSYPRADQNVTVPTQAELADLSKELNSRSEMVREEIGTSLPKANLSIENCGRCEVRQLCAPYWTTSRQNAPDIPAQDAKFDDIEIVRCSTSGDTLGSGMLRIQPNSERFENSGSSAGF